MEGGFFRGHPLKLFVEGVKEVHKMVNEYGNAIRYAESFQKKCELEKLGYHEEFEPKPAELKSTAKKKSVRGKKK